MARTREAYLDMLIDAWRDSTVITEWTHLVETDNEYRIKFPSLWAIDNFPAEIIVNKNLGTLVDPNDEQALMVPDEYNLPDTIKIALNDPSIVADSGAMMSVIQHSLPTPDMKRLYEFVGVMLEYLVSPLKRLSNYQIMPVYLKTYAAGTDLIRLYRQDPDQEYAISPVFLHAEYPDNRLTRTYRLERRSGDPITEWIADNYRWLSDRNIKGNVFNGLRHILNTTYKFNYFADLIEDASYVGGEFMPYNALHALGSDIDDVRIRPDISNDSYVIKEYERKIHEGYTIVSISGDEVVFDDRLDVTYYTDDARVVVTSDGIEFIMSRVNTQDFSYRTAVMQEPIDASYINDTVDIYTYIPNIVPGTLTIPFGAGYQMNYAMPDDFFNQSMLRDVLWTAARDILLAFPYNGNEWVLNLLKPIQDVIVKITKELYGSGFDVILEDNFDTVCMLNDIWGINTSARPKFR